MQVFKNRAIFNVGDKWNDCNVLESSELVSNRTTLTVLLEYFYLSNGIVQSADFLAVKALLSPQNASIIPDYYTYLLW